MQPIQFNVKTGHYITNYSTTSLLENIAGAICIFGAIAIISDMKDTSSVSLQSVRHKLSIKYLVLLYDCEDYYY